jgi:nucleoside 2-deoxyribosyltransferase
VVLPALRDAAFEPLDPWELDAASLAIFMLPVGHPDRAAQLPAVNQAVGRRNADLIREAAGVLAFLDGPDVDSGTAAEVGYAAALGRPIVGLRTDLRLSGDNEASIVNLQVEWFIAESGGTLCRDLDDAIYELSQRVAPRAGN